MRSYSRGRGHETLQQFRRIGVQPDEPITDYRGALKDGQYLLQQIGKRKTYAKPQLRPCEGEFMAGAPRLAPSACPRDAFVWFLLERLRHIDTVQQVFEVELVWCVSWIEDDKENIQVSEGDSTWQLKHFKWHPQVKWVNAISEVKDKNEEWYRVCKADQSRTLITVTEYTSNPPQTVWIRQFKRQVVTFAYKMDLYRFPFDLQRLAMTLTTSWSSDRVLLRFDESDRLASMISAMTHLQDWTIHSPYLVAYNMDGALQSGLPLLSDAKWSRTGQRYSRLHIVPFVARRSAPFMFNIFGIQCVLTSLIFTTYQMPSESLSDRLSIDMTLILVSVAFKLTAAAEIPKVPYLTWLDKYLLVSFVFLGFIACEHALAATQYFEERDQGDPITFESEGFIVVVTASIWVIINIAFLGSGWHYLSFRARQAGAVDKYFDEMGYIASDLMQAASDDAGQEGGADEPTDEDFLSVQQKLQSASC